LRGRQRVNLMFGLKRASEMESDEAAVPDDPFLGLLGRCPHCGAAFSLASSDRIGQWVYAVARGGGRAEGGTVFRSRCGECGTPVCSPGTGPRTWAECNPAAAV
jgi:hypothetical protein